MRQNLIDYKTNINRIKLKLIIYQQSMHATYLVPPENLSISGYADFTSKVNTFVISEPHEILHPSIVHIDQRTLVK